MAGVTRSPGTLRRSGADRGQLLLVTALGLTALLVVLALVLSSVIYTGDLSTRGTKALDETNVLHVQNEGVAVATRAIDAENDGGVHSYESMRANVSRELSTWSDLSARLAAVNARSTSLQVVSTTNGTRLVQDEVDTMTNRTGASRWTLVNDATEVRRFDVTVTPSSLVDATGNDSSADLLADRGAFAVVYVTDTGWSKVFVYRVNGDVAVRVVSSDGYVSERYSVDWTTGNVTVDLVNATIGGRNAPALRDFANLSTPYDVSFHRGANATGVYDFVVDRPAIDGDVAPPGSVLPGPRGYRFLYSVSVTFRYVSQELTYETTVDVPGGVGP